MVVMPLLCALLLQDGYDLTLSQSKGQEQAYRHEIGPVTIDVVYSIEDLDPKIQHSGDYSGQIRRLDWGDGKLEKGIKPFRFRSGLHG